MSPTLMLSLFIAAADKPPMLTELAPNAAGLALVEVVSVRDVDSRPNDGPLYAEIKLRVIKSTGAVESKLAIVKAPGGLGPPPIAGPKKPLPSPLKPNSLKKGEEYWIAFSSQYEQLDRFPEGVINFWKSDDEKFAEVFDEAVRADSLQWRPQFDPKLGLSENFRVDADKKQFTIRVQKDGKVLWEKVIPGIRTESPFSQGFWDNGYNDFPRQFPKCGKILIAESIQTLEAKNEFDVQAGPYRICTAFDPENGQRMAVWIARPQTSDVAILHRDYNPKTGALKEEHRYSWPEKGGKDLGQKEERWWRRDVRFFDFAGRVTKEEVFWYDASREGERWVKIGK
jgi:hypothetical protein